MLNVFRTRCLRPLIIVTALALLGGCSALRIGYATAPDLVYWWADGYVDFNGDQTVRVREAIRQWFAWNRRTQLPEYAALLSRAEAEVLADTTPAKVCDWQGEFVKRSYAAYDRIAPAVVDLMPTITPEQIRHIEKKYDKVNADFRDEYLQSDPKKRAEANFKRTIDRAETLYGRFDDAQRGRIAEGLTRSPFDAEVWLAERRQRQQDALQLLRKSTDSGGMSREQAMAALHGYVERLEHSPRESYRRYSERLMEFNCGFAAALHNMTAPTQRRTAADNLAGWRGDLRAIAAARASDEN